MIRYTLILLICLLQTNLIAQDPLDRWIRKLEEHKFKNWDSLQYYCLKIIENTTESDLKARGIAYQNLGVAQFNIHSDYDSALSLYDRSAGYLENLGDSTLLALLNNSYGVVMKYRAEYDSALVYFFKSLEYTEGMDTLDFRVSVLNNIGEVTYNMGHPEDAEKYHRMAFELAEKMNDSLLIGNTHLYLGNLSVNQQNFNEAIGHYQQCLEFLESYDVSKAVVGMNLGTVYHFQGDLEQAISYYQAGIEEGKKFGDQATVALCYLNYGEALVDLKRPNAAEMLRNAIDLANNLGMKRIIAIAQQLLSRHYEQQQSYQKALDHFRLYKLYSDSVLNESSQSQLQELQVKFETSQKEKQISEQELLLEQKNASISRQKSQTLIIVLTLVFLLILGGLNYWNYRAKQKVKLQTALLEEKEKGLEAVVQATEEERNRISRELHDGVGQQLSGVKMKLESIGNEISDPEMQARAQSISEILKKTSDEVRQISHQMMPRTLQEEGLLPALEDLIRGTFHGSSISCTFEHKIRSGPMEKKMTLNIFRSVQEILNNIIKHSGAKNVSIQFYEIKNKMILTVEDDGVGFELDTTKGHGLHNITSRIQMLGGKVNIESELKKGIILTLSIPMS